MHLCGSVSTRFEGTEIGRYSYRNELYYFAAASRPALRVLKFLRYPGSKYPGSCGSVSTRFEGTEMKFQAVEDVN